MHAVSIKEIEALLVAFVAVKCFVVSDTESSVCRDACMRKGSVAWSVAS